MSCNCHEEHSNLNTWGCGCNKMPEEPKRKGVVKFCDICDPCAEGVTNVKICAFVVPTLEEGRYYKNSFIFVQEDDSVYFISDDRSEIPFGSRPKYIDNFDPEDSANKFKNTTVYDMVGGAAYVYGPDGTYLTIPLTATPITSISGGDGIIVTATGGDYSVAVDPQVVASAADLAATTQLATNHTSQIGDLQSAQDTMAGDIETIQDDLAHAHDLIDDANELAVEAKENAAAAQQTANDALSAVATKQDTLTPGTNITIANNVISATDTTYGRATATTNGLMGSKDREALVDDGLTTLGSVATNASEVEIGYSVNKSSADGSSYSSTNGTITLPAATSSEAGVMTAADKTKLDNLTPGGGGGGVIELTVDDYNAPASNPTSVALGLLEPGVYTWKGNVNVRIGSSGSDLQYYEGRTAIVGYGNPMSSTSTSKFVLLTGGVNASKENPTFIKFYTITNDGATGISISQVLTTYNCINTLTNTSVSVPLSANQGKVLKDLIDALDARVSALEGN